MTLDQFVEEEKKRILRFQSYWHNKRLEESKSQWPLNMTPGEWDEQFRCFEE